MRQEFANIEGAFPILDRKKIGKAYTVEGQNYLVDLDGPRAAFGYQQTAKLFNPSQLMQSFEVGSTIFYFSRDVDESFVNISTFDWPNKQIIPVKQFISSDLFRPKLNLPWTHAYVGTYHYFANRTWGVLRYDAINQAWEDVTSTIGIANIFFITEAGGRLCTLAEGITSWSAIDDGLDNVPDPATGAGFQALSLVGTLEKNSDYLGIQKTSKGYMCLTTKGVLRSESIDSINPFRHVAGEAKHKPITPWCVTKITDTDVIILSRNGLFISSDGATFQEWQPLQGEYFKKVAIPPLLSLQNGFIAVNYSVARDELYVSFAQSEIIGQYTKAWVLYVKRDAWSTFNHTHKGFIFVDVNAIGLNYQQAYIDSAGHVRYLDDGGISLAMEPQNLKAVYVQPLLQFPYYSFEGVARMRSNTRIAGFSKLGYPEVAGFYEAFGRISEYRDIITSCAKTVTEGTVNIMPACMVTGSALIVRGKTAQELSSYSLNSFVELGLFRFTDDETNDQFSLITNVAISCLDATESSGSVYDDWFLDYPADVFEDWLAITPDEFEDWGLSTITGSLYQQRIKGTLDGYIEFEDQEAAIAEVLIDGKTKFCSSDSAGIYQSITLEAFEIGETFHVKTLEINGILIGRL